MTSAQPQQYEIGIVGLGVMGRNLLLNMADHGFSVAGHDKDPGKAALLREESKGRNVRAETDIQDFIALLRQPRAVMLLVPAGSPVDAVVNELHPYLHAGDLIIDAGNSHFRDTDSRARDLMAQYIQFLGVGISGGEEGARAGPSIMPGGARAAYERVRPLFEAIAARVNNAPCVTYLGPGSAGHFVKMVHNGIEYGIMQLIAESYDLMKRGLGLNNDQLRATFSAWNGAELDGYLIEITSRIFARRDDNTGGYLVDEILDVSGQKGTGAWTSQCALELQVPVPSIDAAVTLRNLSALTREREQAGAVYPQPVQRPAGEHDVILTQLRHALFAGMIVVYAQGFALLQAASSRYGYDFELDAVARIWRGGCIIRSALLEDISAAFRARRDLPNLLLDPNLAQKVMNCLEDMRQTVCTATRVGVPLPGLMASLGYLDSYRSTRLPANLIQAQRDYFGAHTYQLVGSADSFHTDWQRGSDERRRPD